MHPDLTDEQRDELRNAGAPEAVDLVVAAMIARTYKVGYAAGYEQGLMTSPDV